MAEQEFAELCLKSDWGCFQMANFQAIPLCYPSFREIQPLLCNSRSSLRISLQKSTHFFTNELLIMYYLLKNNYPKRQLNISRLKRQNKWRLKSIIYRHKRLFFWSVFFMQSSKTNSVGLIQWLQPAQLSFLGYCSLGVFMRSKLKWNFDPKTQAWNCLLYSLLVWKHYLQKSNSTDFE